MRPNIKRPTKTPVTGLDLKNFEGMQQAFVEGKKAQGFLFNTITGRQEIRIPIPGQARTFLGFNIIADRTVATAVPFTILFSLNLNNDVIVQGCATSLFSPTNNIASEYYKYCRPLTGSDTLIIVTDNPALDTFRTIFQFYYSER